MVEGSWSKLGLWLEIGLGSGFGFGFGVGLGLGLELVAKAAHLLVGDHGVLIVDVVLLALLGVPVPEG